MKHEYREKQEKRSSYTLHVVLHCRRTVNVVGVVCGRLGSVVHSLPQCLISTVVFHVFLPQQNLVQSRHDQKTPQLVCSSTSANMLDFLGLA